MILTQLKLKNFRNYAHLQIQFGEGVNIIYGENGHGKTNLLESIYYMAISKSFRTHINQELLLYQQDFFEIDGAFLGNSENRKELNIRTYWDKKNKKNFWKNKNKVEALQNYIGTIPIVLLIPSDLEITKGAPEERRKFMNILLGQSHNKYLKNLIQYKKYLRSKNLILLKENPDKTLLESFTQKMAEVADSITHDRILLSEWVNEKIELIYSKISGKDDKVKIIYNPSYLRYGKEISFYKKIWPTILAQEMQRKRTLLGPQLDNFKILLNGKPIKKYGSQGENKTAVIALKLCEYYYLYKETKERPIMLFDDIFGELDKNRIKNMLNSLGEIAQVFVTTTSPDFFNKLSLTAKNYYYHIENGLCTKNSYEQK